MAASREACLNAGKLLARSSGTPFITATIPVRSRPFSSKSVSQIRPASTTAAASTDHGDLESLSSLGAPVSDQPFDPAARARKRNRRLPSSRYSFRPPKYYRGPLHPHQPPPPSDPASREFVPGPFTLPRASQSYTSTVEQDLMVLAYQHFPPGFEAATKAPRLRAWDESSPYHKNRPLRGPRGGDALRLLRKPITFRNVPRLEGITVHSFVNQAATEGSAPLHVAGMALQAITGVRAVPHAARHNVVQWGVRAGKNLSLTCDLRGEDMYNFLAKTVDVVMPRIKDWKGVRGTAGDGSGNITFGFTPEMLAYYPEIEVNYDSYPPKMIPGCHITVKTTARSDREARLLLTAMGVPFFGKLVD